MADEKEPAKSNEHHAYLAKLSSDLRDSAMNVCDGSGYYCEAPMELLERAANEIDRLLEFKLNG